jgi:hypothetical protein
MYTLRSQAQVATAVAGVALVCWRAVGVVQDLTAGHEHALLAYPLTVIFPAVLIAVLLLQPPTETREGLLMRVGTVIQLLLIIALPGLALYLALGFPVVFLVVELFETRLNPRLRDRLVGLVVI